MMKTITSLKKLFTLALLVVMGQTAANAASKLYFSDFTIAAGATQDIQLLFDTDAEDVKNIDATITLPEGLSYVEFDENEYAQLDEDRLAGMISFNYAKGTLKIKCLGGVIAKGEGPIATFKVKASEALAMTSNIEVSNVVLTKTNDATENLDAATAVVTRQPDLALAFDAETVELAAGDTKDINVSMTSAKKIAMLEATLVLPEGITANVAAGERLSADPSYNAATGKIAITSGIKTGEGPLFVITLKADESFTAAGEVQLTGIVGTTSAAKAYKTDDITVAVTVKQGEQPEQPTETVVYSWSTEQGEEGVIINEVGGKAVASEEGRVGYANQVGDVTYTTISLNGKKDFSTQTVTITLDNELKAGDKIAITAYRNKDAAEKKSGALLKFEKGETTVSTATNGGLEFVNLNEAVKGTEEYGTEPNTVTLTVPEDAAGSKVITMTRAETATNLFITKLEITTEATTTGISTVAVGKKAEGIYTISGQRVKAATKGLYIINGKKVMVK